jgi:hypothetical protein
MNGDRNPLYDLLPAVHRLRDMDRADPADPNKAGPLRALLDVIADTVAVLDEDLAQLYDDQFIETCAPWAVPYIGDLIGYRSLHPAPGLGSPRAEVANTIGYRRRKGTAAMLEQLARDVTGWPARVVEFFELLTTTQFVNHLRPHSVLTPDLRRWDVLEVVDTPFDVSAHTPDVRRIASGEGKHNIPNVGLFLWRLGAYRLTRSPAVGLDARRWFFSPLGVNVPLFTRPQTEPTVTHLATRLNVPAPIGRRRLRESLADYYGDGLSILIEGVPIDQVRVCDLSDDGGGWAHTPPPAGAVAIDPALGRLAFGDPQAAPPLVTFHYGFSADLGGGEYERAASFDLPAQPVLAVAAPELVADALANRVSGEAIQISDGGRYVEPLAITVQPGERFELRSANDRRATLVLGGDLVIDGGDDTAEVSLNGLLVLGGRIRVTAALRRLRLRHCTLVPGLALNPDGTPTDPGEPSLVVESGGVAVEIDRCILGGVRWHDLSTLTVTDSIVDATDPAGVALAGLGAVAANVLAPAGGTLRVEECTVVGKVHARILELASNAIFVARAAAGDGWPAPVLVDRRQTGCVRFSFVPDGSRTPRRYRCQPELEVQTRTDEAEKEAQAKNQTLSTARRAAIRAGAVARVKPAFTSRRYGDPGYMQLRGRVPAAIRRGADDEAAMGAFHDLYEPQRLANLRVRLEEYLRVGLEAGVFPVT